MEEVVPRIKNSFNIAFFLIYGMASQVIFIKLGFILELNQFIGILIGVNWFYVPIFAFQNNAQQIRTMVMKEPVIIGFNPMVDSH